MNWKLPAATFLASYTLCVAGAGAGTLLYGSVEVNGDLPSAPSAVQKFNVMEPKLDSTAPKQEAVAPIQDCVCFDQTKIQIKEVNGRYKLVDGDHWILDFAEHKEQAIQAMSLIKHYRLNNLCFVGRPFEDGKIKMMYLTSGGAAPEGPYPGEDAIAFDVSKVSAKQVQGSWKIVEEPDHWMLDFGSDEKAARDAESILRYYGFTHECFVGRPGAPLMYFRK